MGLKYWQSYKRLKKSRHEWKDHERMMLCLILKETGYKFCTPLKEKSEIAAKSMNEIYQTTEFTKGSIETQIYNVTNYVDVPLATSLKKMLYCMVKTGMMTQEEFLEFLNISFIKIK